MAYVFKVSYATVLYMKTDPLPWAAEGTEEGGARKEGGMEGGRREGDTSFCDLDDRKITIWLCGFFRVDGVSKLLCT